MYAKEAVFHDPIGIADGIESIRAQFNGLVKVGLSRECSCIVFIAFLQLFPRADIPRFRVLENPSSVPKSTILIDQDVAYFRDPKASSPTKVSEAYNTPNDHLS